jgi:hypothetical protein
MEDDDPVPGGRGPTASFSCIRPSRVPNPNIVGGTIPSKPLVDYGTHSFHSTVHGFQVIRAYRLLCYSVYAHSRLAFNSTMTPQLALVAAIVAVLALLVAGIAIAIVVLKATAGGRQTTHDL